MVVSPNVGRNLRVSVALDVHGLKLEKDGPTFSGFNE